MIVEVRPPVEGILLVHNDNQLRDFCRDCFKKYGFRAIEAEDGFEALLIAASRERPIGLFITDIENASINGIELPSMLQSISPQIKVVYLTGSGKKSANSPRRKLASFGRLTALPLLSLRNSLLPGADSNARTAVLGPADTSSTKFTEFSPNGSYLGIATRTHNRAAHDQLQSADSLQQERPLHG